MARDVLLQIKVRTPDDVQDDEVCSYVNSMIEIGRQDAIDTVEEEEDWEEGMVDSARKAVSLEIEQPTVINPLDWNCGGPSQESLRPAKAESYRRILKSIGYSSPEALGMRSLWPEDVELQAMFRKVEAECQSEAKA